MAARPEEATQIAGLNHPHLGVMTATEMKRKQRKDKLPCLSNYAPWKDCFYEKVQQRCLSLQETKVKMIHAQKAKEEKVEKREPCDWLSKEWFSEDKESLDTRIYLLDKLLPTLIPAVENLLMEVERKNVLAPDKEPTKFNPINFLGEYLMRHHPLYGISIKPGPYLRGMKMVLEQLKAEVPGTASERLARLKSEAKNKRKEREQVEIMKSQVKKMRKEALAVQFREWTVDVSGRIPVALVQSALRSFLDVIASTPIDVRKVYDKKLEVVNTLEKKVNTDEFTEYVHFYTEHFSDDTFQEILKHFRQCADDFREAVRHDTWRRMFADLFLDRDYGKVGLLDRQKILALLVDFYDNSPVAAKRGFCNPRQWPIIELQEIELADLWGGLDDQEDIKTERQTESASAERQEEDFPESASPGYSLGRDGKHGSEKQVEEEEFSLGREPDTETNREEDYRMLDREPGSEGQVSQEGNNLVAEATNTISGPAPEAVTVTSENRALADTDIIASEQDALVAKAVRETPARKESFSRQHGSQFDQQTSSETRWQDEDLVQDQGEGPAHSDRQDSPAEASQEFEVPWSGDLLTSDLTFRYSSYGEKIPKDWKCHNTKFPDLCPVMAEIQNHGASCTRSAFDKSCLNLPQFVQLMEIFVGEDISLPTVKRLIAFIKEEYKQTEEEKMEQLKKIHRRSCLAQRKLLLEALFEKWDNNASGFLDLEEVDAVLSTFKEGMEKEALRKAKQHLCSRYPQLSRVKKLSPEAFQTFLELVASEFTGDEDEAIDNLVEFLTTSIERSSTECLQSSTRRKWLHSIQQAAETSGASMEGVYKAVFKALSQDAEAHGDNKKISAYIALLEENQLSPERGQILLRYVACTADDAPYVLNKILYIDMKGVSFTAVEEGKPIHVPRVQLHGNIHFWNYDRPVEERKGSFLVLPLHDACWRVFGILGVDTLQDQCEKTIFLTHEISFYQGVSHAFSKAYHHIRTLKNVLQMTVTALDWLYPRAPSVHTVTTYLVEPGKDKTCDYALRKMITTDNTGQKEIHSSPELLLRKENLLRDYLFKCTDSSAVIHASVCREQHIAVPLRDPSGRAFGLFDISIGHHQKLPPHEHKDLQKMLKVAQASCSEILKMSSEETEPTDVLEAEHVANSRHAGILFHRFMLQDLRECIQKLDAESFAEMKSYVEPPALVHNVVKAVLLLLHPNWKGSEETENWSQCKLKLDDNLIQEIYCFNPTAASVQVQAELLLGCITGECRAETGHQGWWPAQLLGHWVHTCLALAQGTSSPHVTNKRRFQAGDGLRGHGGFSPPSLGNPWPREGCPPQALPAAGPTQGLGSAPFGSARLLSLSLGSARSGSSPPRTPRPARNSLFRFGTFATRQWAAKKTSSPTSVPLRPLSSSLTERDRGAAGAAGVGSEGVEVGRLGREESAAAERPAALPSGGSGRDKMAALSKQYGLIMPKKVPQKNLVSKKLSVFADDSDEEPSVGESLQKEALKKQAMKQTKLEIQKALEEDATVYEYDSIYDEMQQKKKESNARVLSGKDDKKPRYIQNILKAAEIRKKEQEKRMERKIQKEREMEGGEFAHKEAFVTSAYKKKLQERAEEEERERREAALEACLDVTKQKDLSGFYRHLLNQRVGEEETPKCSFREARIKEEKPDSYDESNQRNKCPYEGQKLEPSVKKENNPDADTDLGTDSSDDDKRHKSSKVNLKKKRRASSVSSEEEAKLPKSQRHSRSPSSSSVEEELHTKAQTNHLTKRGESRPSRRGDDEQYRERDYERSRTHEKDHQREKEDRHRYGDHSSKDNYRRREEQDDKQRGKERKEREGHGREWRKAKEREEKGSEKEREKERIRNGRDRYNDREKERGEKCREKEDHVKERREKYGSDEKRYRERRASSPTSLEKDGENNLEKERKGKEREVDEKGRSSSGILSEQKRKAGEEGEKEEKEQAPKPPESMSKFAKRSNEETVMSARDRYLARQMARVSTKSYIEKEED